MNNTSTMGRKKLGRERINITLPEGMADSLTDVASRKGWDRSRLIEELAATYLKKLDKEASTKAKGKK